MNIQVFRRGSSTQLTPHFKSSEFDCKCGRCEYTIIDIDHLNALEQLRVTVGRPITITSGFRCTQHNCDIGGEVYSFHQLGMATDIQVSGLTAHQVWTQYLREISKFNGVGIYPSFIHLDSRNPKHKARW